jgi:hypothetical protein
VQVKPGDSFCPVRLYHEVVPETGGRVPFLIVFFGINHPMSMDNDQKRWETPNMTEYGSVEELTTDKDLGGDDGGTFQSDPIAS